MAFLDSCQKFPQRARTTFKRKGGGEIYNVQSKLPTSHRQRFSIAYDLWAAWCAILPYSTSRQGLQQKRGRRALSRTRKWKLETITVYHRALMHTATTTTNNVILSYILQIYIKPVRPRRLSPALTYRQFWFTAFSSPKWKTFKALLSPVPCLHNTPAGEEPAKWLLLSGTCLYHEGNNNLSSRNCCKIPLSLLTVTPNCPWRRVCSLTLRYQSAIQIWSPYFIKTWFALHL